MTFRHFADIKIPLRTVFENFTRMKKTIQQLLVCMSLGCAISAFAQSDPPGAIVVDNAAAEFDGNWTLNKAAADKIGPDYMFASSIASPKPTATATYRPKLPTSGKYDVQIYYAAGDRRHVEAKWLVTFDGGKEEVSINQTKEGGKWVSIAKAKPFAAGSAGFVVLGNHGPSTGMVVIADAVRFVPVAGTDGPKSGFSLNVTAAYGGAVSTSPNQPSYEPKSLVSLQAKASDGYVFNGWSGDADGWKNPLRVTMTTNKTITANFIAAGVGIIMDNQVAEKPGKWQASTTAWAGTWYDDYDFAVSKKTADSTATYKPNVPKAGKYDVYIRYAQGSNRATKVPWTVSHKGGKVNAVIDQQKQGGEWIQIANGVEFDAGKSDKQYAEVNNGTGSEGAVVVADAVAFVYVGK